MKNVLITGGLGYLGTKLCEILTHNLTVVDNRFLPESVEYFKENKIKYYQMDLLDEKLAKIVNDADIIYHLAGVTDVAYMSTEENKELEDSIKRAGIDGTNVILDNMRKDAKLIFPSTHVIFEGYEETILNLKEDAELKPVLTYSRVKAQNEKDIMKKCNNYAILRLGSVYGRGRNMRMGILPNLFSKLTSQKEVIRLFNGGRQLKSVVSVFDVVRCMKFMAEKEITGTFHCCNENITVKEIAEMCNDIKEVEIIETDDETPNKGYTLSNKKLLNTGFVFKSNLKESIKKMIQSWSTE